MDNGVKETDCTRCIHRNVCKWKDDFLTLVQKISEVQFQYGTDVDEDIHVSCRERKEETPQSKNMGF